MMIFSSLQMPTTKAELTESQQRVNLVEILKLALMPLPSSLPVRSWNLNSIKNYKVKLNKTFKHKTLTLNMLKSKDKKLKQTPLPSTNNLRKSSIRKKSMRRTSISKSETSIKKRNQKKLASLKNLRQLKNKYYKLLPLNVKKEQRNQFLSCLTVNQNFISQSLKQEN